MKNYRTFFHVPITYIPLSSSLMKYLTLPFPSSTLLALYRKVYMYYPQIYTSNLSTPINTFCLAAVILLMWLRAYHTVKLLESGEFAPPINFWKNDWINLKIIWKEGVTNKILSRKVLSKLITSPGAAYFSTKKNRNVKEPLVSSHTTHVWETASHYSWALDIRRKKFHTVQSLSWASRGCLQTTKQSEKPVGAGRDVKMLFTFLSVPFVASNWV